MTNRHVYLSLIDQSGATLDELRVTYGYSTDWTADLREYGLHDGNIKKSPSGDYETTDDREFQYWGHCAHILHKLEAVDYLMAREFPDQYYYFIRTVADAKASCFEDDDPEISLLIQLHAATDYLAAQQI